MRFSRDTIELFVLFILSIIDSRYLFGFQGRKNGDGTVTIDVPGKPGFVYVRVVRGGSELSTVVAINIGAPPNPNLLVRMERRGQHLVIIDPDPSAAVELFGGAVGNAAVPSHQQIVGSGIEDPVQGRRFLPGLLSPSTSGGLNVRVDAFFMENGIYVPLDLSFPIGEPATTDLWAWVLVYADSTGTLQYDVSAVEVADESLLDMSTIGSEFTLPDGATPVGAVAVQEGGSVTVNSQFVDFRFHLGATSGVLGGSVNFAALTDDTTPALTDYALLDDGSNKKATLANVLKLANAEVTTTSTGNIDNFAIGTAPITLLRMNNASDATLRGMAAGVGGQIVIIESVGAGNVYLAHQNASSSAANRLINPVANINTPLVAGKGAATYVYDAATQRWRLMNHEQGGFVSYAPVWSSSGTAPSIGNGAITASYKLVGTQVYVYFVLAWGSTTTGGTGMWSFTLPASNAGLTMQVSGAAYNAGTGAQRITIGLISGGKLVFIADSTSTYATGIPFTWVNTSNIVVSGWYLTS